MVRIPLDEIKPYWRNPRNNDGAVEAVKASIVAYGMNVPLVLDPERVIIAGHTRYRALRELGAKEAPCIVLDLPPDKAKEYRLVDNGVAEIAEWDMAMLIPELREVADLEAMEVFFPSFDLESLVQESAGGSSKGPTQDRIDARSNELDQQMERRQVQTLSDIVTMTCPHCGEDYEVSRSEIASSRE